MKTILIGLTLATICLTGCATVDEDRSACTTNQMISDQVTRIIGATQGVVYAGGC